MCYPYRSKKKGQAETPFIFTMAIIIVFLIWFTTQIQGMYPQFQGIQAFDFAYFGGAILGIAGACSISTGLVCGGALLFFSVTGFFIVQNTLIYTMIFIPIALTVAYIISRLARGGG
jgi:hypothetical protein